MSPELFQMDNDSSCIIKLRVKGESGTVRKKPELLYSYLQQIIFEAFVIRPPIRRTAHKCSSPTIRMFGIFLDLTSIATEQTLRFPNKRIISR